MVFSGHGVEISKLTKIRNQRSDTTESSDVWEEIKDSAQGSKRINADIVYGIRFYYLKGS